MAARLLVIEDNPINLELMTYVLESFGFKTLDADNGAAGIAVARREKPDLILCDVQMSGMDGMSVVREIKQDEALRAVPILAVTAFAMSGDRERMLAAGFDGYIAKPIDPQSIAKLVNSFLPSHLQSTSAPVASGQRAAAQEPPPRHDAPATILVMDDSPANLELKRGLLVPHGYTVLTAPNGARGLELARTAPVDLVISDVGMAEGDGFDVIQRFKADPVLRDIPFMFLSSTHWGDESSARGLSLGAVRYLCRPLDPPILLAEIRACLKR